MNVKLIEATPNPEEAMCRAARNDYRSEGIIGYEFEDIMNDVDADEHHINSTEDILEAKKRTLIDHLIKHGHWGPAEHPQAVLAIEGVTRVVTHQIVRHRHFSYDQQSLRYVSIEDVDDVEDQFRIPEFQGDGEIAVSREGVSEIDHPDEVDHTYRAAYRDAISHYQKLLDDGVPQEKARLVLPMGIKTNIVMSGNARAWMHVLNVRDKADVQGETQRCARAINDELRTWMSYTFKKYEEDVRPMRLNP